ncbi:MAG: hypothetical protein WBC50_02240 [Dehalococcoidales bacterium]
MNNRTKTNQQLLTDYLDFITVTHAPSYASKAKRLVDKFFDTLGEFPPSTELAIRFLTQYRERAPNTIIRYTFMLSAFFRWYSNEKLAAARPPRILPQRVPYEDFETLLGFINNLPAACIRSLPDTALSRSKSTNRHCVGKRFSVVEKRGVS